MSLSFVSKSVLTQGTDGYEETPIESKDNGDNSSSQAEAKPLFEQLRDNKEQEELEREEFQRSIMRGTLALDEEDCAHLDAVAKERVEREKSIQSRTEAELALFRAAQADLLDKESDAKEDATTSSAISKDIPTPPAVNNASIPKIKPMFIKKRRRQDAPSSKKEPKTTEHKTQETAPTALSGLLTGYGSDDSD